MGWWILHGQVKYKFNLNFWQKTKDNFLFSTSAARTRRIHHLLGSLLWVIVGVLVKGSPGPQQYRVIVVHLCLECSRAADVFAREPMRPRASDPWAHLVASPQLPRTTPGRKRKPRKTKNITACLLYASFPSRLYLPVGS